MDSQSNPQLYLSILQAQLALIDRRERKRRTRGAETIPEGIYEIIEDIGRIEGAIESLEKVWHKDDDNFRKGMMHLSKVSWDLREKMRDILRK